MWLEGPFRSFLVAGLHSFGSAKVSGLGFWISRLGFQVSGLGFGVRGWPTRSEGWAQVFWGWAPGFEGWATRVEGWAPQFCGYLLGFGAKTLKPSHLHFKNIEKHEEKFKKGSQWGSGLI